MRSFTLVPARVSPDGGGLIISGVLEHYDADDGVMFLRLNSGVLMIAITGEAPVGIVGETVRFRTAPPEVYAVGM
jgi:hypothetical protein